MGSWGDGFLVTCGFLKKAMSAISQDYPKNVKGMGLDLGFIMSNYGINSQRIINLLNGSAVRCKRKQNSLKLSICIYWGNNIGLAVERGKGGAGRG